MEHDERDPAPGAATREAVPRPDTAAAPIIAASSVAVPVSEWGVPAVTARIDVAPEPESPAPRTRRAWLAALAALGAVVTAVLHGIAVDVAAGGDAAVGTALAWAAIAASGATVLVSLVGLVVGPRRTLAGLAGVVAVLANPWVVLHVLAFLSA